MSRTAVGLGMALVALILPASATAAQRFASVNGAGAACSSGSPCLLTTAVTGAGANDEVIVNPGTYSVTSGITTAAANLFIHGAAGKSRPRLIGNASVTKVLNLTGANGTVSQLYIEGHGTNHGALRVDGPTTIEGVELNTFGNNAQTLLLSSSGTSLVRNSLIRAAGTGATGLDGFDGSYNLRNLTVIASGTDSVGVEGAGFKPAATPENVTLSLRNVIARGGKNDLTAITILGGTSALFVHHSNYRPGTNLTDPGDAITDQGNNQSTAPLFVNQAAGNFHEFFGSPTIDAGVTAALNGIHDLDGNARVRNGKTDIGAYEFDPVRPRITDLRMAPGTWRVDSNGPAEVQASKHHKGTTIGYRLADAQAARVVFTIERKSTGRKISKNGKGKCVKLTHKNRHRPPCPRFTKTASFAQQAAQGSNTKPFSGKIGFKRLKPGFFHLSVVGTNAAGSPSRPAIRSFKIVRR